MEEEEVDGALSSMHETTYSTLSFSNQPQVTQKKNRAYFFVSWLKNSR
jgi:hypothetical protein